MMRIAVTCVAVGVLLVTAGVWLIAWPAGVAMVGVWFILAGLIMETGR